MRALLLYQADPAYQEIYLTDTAENLKTVEPLLRAAAFLLQQRVSMRPPLM